MAEEGEKQGIEQQLEHAVCSRLQHFKDQADSLTLESVRRLLEKDLGLEKFALDAHKRFIRHYLEKKMEDADDCKPETEKENENEKDVHLSKEDATILPKQNESNNDLKKSSTGDEEMMEDSPIMGVLTPKSEIGAQGPLNESRIEKAILERADHFLANSENLTLAGVRRLLEEDLGLDKNDLDPFKKFISQQIDQVLNPPKAAKPVKNVKKKTSENLKSKKVKTVSSEEGSESLPSESDEIEDKVKSKKESASRKNTKKLEQPKKRKSDLDVSGKKPSKLPKRQKEEDNDSKEEDNNSGEDGSLSEDGQSQSSVEKHEKPAQRKEKPVPAYGKKVENLKSIIKACGMSIPPVIYKKAKQVPDNKREAVIIQELEGILLREGLSKNPSEKEIKDCKKRKETARELEGIDMSNIISSSRRRSTFSFGAPAKPEARAKKDSVDSKESKKKVKKEKDKDSDNEEATENAEKEENADKAEEEEKAEKEKAEKESEGEVEEVEEEEEEEEEEEDEDDDDSDEFNADDDEESD